MLQAEYCCSVFNEVIRIYHVTDEVNTPYPFKDAEYDIHENLKKKAWVDCVQWHLEDIIRRPDLDPQEFIEIKRRIDRSNQIRTDLVEKIDDWFLWELQKVKHQDNPRIPTESPAWAIDRLSILMLKIYHMREQMERNDVNQEHIDHCAKKYEVLMTQKLDLCFAINALIGELKTGAAAMKVYRQMKMYNDPSTNPQLYSNKD